ncbi:MAG TPA: O-antigen ligase family protein, partial [Blastocatellia bacterium]|nr:O-antigen ligase family protein [Blastocatellia bacterium]
MKVSKKRVTKAVRPPRPSGVRARRAVFLVLVSLIIIVPLAFSVSLHRPFLFPKLATLVVGASTLIPLLALAASEETFGYLKSKHTLLVFLFIVVVSISTLLGVAPVASFLGSPYNKMGLMTHVCFFICFSGLIMSVGASRGRFKVTLWVMAATGLTVATYAYLQFFGRDPFMPASLYTFDSGSGPVVRVNSTLGHANYLGNFLLYTTPLSAGLALASRGQSRLVGFIIAAVSTAAVVFSGTRGAWLGLATGAVVFVALMIKDGRRPLDLSRRAVMIWAAIAMVAVLTTATMIAFNPASSNIVARSRTLFTEGFTGAGRTLLWRDSIRMIPAFSLTGAGPEGFRKAFLAYKSEDLARFSPQINNESSHNSYIDAAISYGLPGVILYVAVIASSLALLFVARRRAIDFDMRARIAGLIASLLAVATHNFFIFDQIPTGLYFFLFAALALVATNITRGEETAGEHEGGFKESRPSSHAIYLKRAVVVAGCAIAVGGAWYSISLVRADAAINRALDAAAIGDLEKVRQEGRRARNAPDPAREFQFLFSRTLAICAEQIELVKGSGVRTSEKKNEAIRLAIRHAQESIAHTLTPDVNHLLIAYLGLIGGDWHALREHAAEAIKWDPNFSNARWLMAEAYLKEGDLDRARVEAERAVALKPSSRDAISALKRARPDMTTGQQSVEKMLSLARSLTEEGRTKKAQRVILKAFQKAKGPCAACHRELAVIHEAAGLRENAIAEW